MTSAFAQIWDLAEEKGLSTRGAAYALALRRIGEAVEAQGTRDYFRQ